MHIGVDESLGLIDSISTTPENEHDMVQADTLLHGREKRVWRAAGYVGVENAKSTELARLIGS